MSQNSCQPEGLLPESAMAALLVLAIERLLPSPGALPSPILAATHACFTVLGSPLFAPRTRARGFAIVSQTTKPCVHVFSPINRRTRVDRGVRGERFLHEITHALFARHFPFQRFDHHAVRGALLRFGEARDSGLECFRNFEGCS